MDALILAAGLGGRLRPLTTTTPKPLIEIGGRPLIAHVLDALAAAGVGHATIVLGYRSRVVRAAVDELRPVGMSVRFVVNPAPEAGNARSIWEARDHVQAPFLLLMSDHLVEPALMRALAERESERCALAVDRMEPADPRAVDATRALVRDAHVLDLGKHLADWNAIDTGVFRCTRDIFDALTPDLRDGEAAAAFAKLAHEDRLDAVDVTGMRWIDVDTPADIEAAQDWLAAGVAAAAL